MSKSNLVDITSRVLRDTKGKSHQEIVDEMNRVLADTGAEGVVSWDETRRNDNCASYAETRKCHYVDHGDGTKSETWCGEWSCTT